MRHNKNFNHLGRQAGHRKALMSNMASSLILHKRIETTVAKAKAVRQFIEPLVTKSKDDSTHSRRIVFSYLKQKEAVTELFRTIAPKIAERPGGYTRILKTGFRLGDAADMCIIEFVDFNDAYTLGIAPAAAAEAKPKTRRSRKPAAKKTDAVEEATVVEGEAKKAAPKKVSVSGGAGVPGGADRLGQWCPYRDFPLSCPSSGFVRANGFQGKFEKIPGTCNVPGIRSVCRSRFISRSLCRCQGNPRP